MGTIHEHFLSCQHTGSWNGVTAKTVLISNKGNTAIVCFVKEKHQGLLSNKHTTCKRRVTFMKRDVTVQMVTMVIDWQAAGYVSFFSFITMSKR